MVKYILIALSLLSFGAIAEYEYTKPLYILLDKDKNPVPNVSKSTDDSRCLHKANQQPTGTYYCRQSDVTVTVTNDARAGLTTVSWVAPTRYTDESMIKYGDIKNYKVYINGEPVSVSGDKLTHNLDLAPGDYNFCISAIVNGIESECSNIATKTIRL